MKIMIKKLRLIVILVIAVASCKPGADVAVTEKKPEVKNIIFLIGDGMGVSQIYAGMTANKGHLALEKCKHIGFIKTYSSNRYLTDSAAGGTAFSCGKKTKNGMIGMGPDSTSLKTILEIAEENGLSTGLIATSSITHATPASFIAHEVSRNNYEEIAADFLDTDIDLFIGGGRDHFADREDGRDLLKELENNGYTVLNSMEEIEDFAGGKLAGFTANMHNPRYSEGRDNMLPLAVEKAVRLLCTNEQGFFLMVEGSMIDWGGHDNDTDYIVEEMLDFDRAIASALNFAEKDGETLVVITADHETGGMAIHGGNFQSGMVECSFTSQGHTGVMVPVFAYGPGAETFMGIYENTDIFTRFVELFGFDLH